MSSNANRTNVGRAALATGLSLLATALLGAPSAYAAEPPQVETNPTHGYVSDTTARLLGTLNPKGSQIQSCEFEYGTSAAFGQSVPCQSYPEANQAGSEPFTVGAEIEGLAPETTFHFRLVADNGSGGTVAGADRIVVTQPPSPPPAPCANPPGVPHPANLPPCWAYELVSPVITTGSPGGSFSGSLDGDHAFFNALLPVLRDQATGNADTIAMTRTPSGWIYRDLGLDPEHPSDETAVLKVRSSDGTRAIVETCDVSLLGCPIGHIIKYARIDADGTRTMMLEAPNGGGQEGGGPFLAGASADLTRAIFRTEDKYQPLLQEDTHARGKDLYASEEGRLEFLGYDQNGNVLPCGAVVAHGSEKGSGLEQGGISPDARTVTFESPDPEVAGGNGCPAAVDVYIRREGQSTNISSPRVGDPNFGGLNPDKGAYYVGSDRAGDVAYFITKTKLAASDSDELPDLYRYDLASDTVSPLALGADVRQAVVSPEGDYVYFTAMQPIGGEGVAGWENLFLWHAGATRLITTAKGGAFHIGGGLGSENGSPLTPDGRTLLFTAGAQLSGQAIGHVEGGSLRQLFRYSLPEESLTCISCRPDDGVPASRFRWSSNTAFPAGNFDMRVQGDDGRSVFFQSNDALLPEDTNGVGDVYMWRESRLYLVSGGHGEGNSELGSAASSGDSVFFRSDQRLVGGLDTDNFHLYEARLDGGFATPPVPTPCQGEGCRGATSAPAAIPGQASANFSGPANPKPRRPKPRKHKHRKHAHKRAAHKHGGHK